MTNPQAQGQSVATMPSEMQTANWTRANAGSDELTDMKASFK
jgi:hypothetical protein